MTWLLALIPDRYRVLAEILIILAIVGAVWGWIEYGKHHAHEAGLTAGRAEVQAKWDAAVKQQQDAAIAEAATNARETQRRLERQGEAQREQDKEMAQARADAVGAADAAERLRKRADALAAAARRARSDSSTGGNGPASTDPAGVLTDVLGRVVDRARFLAAYADAARRAGLQCARDYDALSTSKGALP